MQCTIPSAVTQTYVLAMDVYTQVQPVLHGILGASGSIYLSAATASIKIIHDYASLDIDAASYLGPRKRKRNLPRIQRREVQDRKDGMQIKVRCASSGSIHEDWTHADALRINRQLMMFARAGEGAYLI